MVKLALRALPEADASARVTVRVRQEGNLRRARIWGDGGAEVAVENAQREKAQALPALRPHDGWPLARAVEIANSRYLSSLGVSAETSCASRRAPVRRGW